MESSCKGDHISGDNTLLGEITPSGIGYGGNWQTFAIRSPWLGQAMPPKAPPCERDMHLQQRERDTTIFCCVRSEQGPLHLRRIFIQSLSTSLRTASYTSQHGRLLIANRAWLWRRSESVVTITSTLLNCSSRKYPIVH